MTLKKIFDQLNFVTQCRRYGISLWQCPQFLFLIMGVFIVVTSLATFAIGSRYIADPMMVALIVLLLTTVLFIIAFIITRSFERLAELARMKSEFIDIVSHQLRSPLTNLKWAVNFLVSGEIGKIEKKQIEYFKILSENADRMGELVEGLLIVSRIEEGNLPLNKREISLQDIVKSAILEFQPFIEASHIEIKFEAAENLPKVFIDPSRIKMVIDNFLSNAIRYVKDKGRVEMKIEKRNNNLYFEIKDDGIGIPKEDQRYIFQKFFRSKNVLKHQTQGSGLGLYISKSIIQKSGGKIGFKSGENKGSTFWFTIPIK